MPTEYDKKAKERLMEKTTKGETPAPGLETPCWNFGGAVASKGKGDHRYFYYNPPEGREETLAHRASYRLFTGPIPDGLLVRHRCDNAPCVNPNHLVLGTQQDNMSDMALRNSGRAASGIKGVYRSGNGWKGEISFRGKLSQTWHKYKEDAAAWVDAKRQQFHGLIPGAPLAPAGSLQTQEAQLALF